MIICDNCKREIGDSMGFCPFCGADLPAKEEKEENTLEQENKTDGAQKKEEKS